MQFPFFYRPDIVPALRLLTDNLALIQAEFAAITEGPWETWPQPIHSGGWSVFALTAFGAKEKGAQCAPKTMALIEQLPIVTAGFSRLAPHTTIAPHNGYEGYSRHYLRCHLPLIVPPPPAVGRKYLARACGLQVGGAITCEIRGYHVGRLLVFDDLYLHSAWNHTDHERVVLLFDIKNPAMPPSPLPLEVVRGFYEQEFGR